MHIISRTTLDRFAARHPEARAVLAVWCAIVERSHFADTHQVRATFPAADFLPGGIVVFDLGGNKYRISANIRYVNEVSRVGRVYIRHVMTHAEYTRRTRDGTL